MTRRWGATLALLLVALLGSSLASEDTVHTSAMAVVNQRARLPCDVTSIEPHDRVQLILWYKGETDTPIYSFDSRGKDHQDGAHWWDTEILDQRSYFQLLPGRTWNGPLAPGAHLEIFPVQARDEGRYRCRVDYVLAPTKNTIVNFTVIIPPQKPEIYNATSHLVVGQSGAAIIGPYNEGEQLDLVCRVAGGRPTPTILWLVNDQVWPTATLEEEEDRPGVVAASLSIPELARHHLHAVFECRTFNFNGSTPLSATATLDMNFRPVNVSILSSHKSLSAGNEYELVCQAWGSRPSAIISWWKGGTTALKDAVMTTSPNSNVTTSILKYRAEMSDSGKQLTCRGQNPDIPLYTEEHSLRLDIFYKPVVTLQMGNTLDPDNIKEGDDVYFECHINANPVVSRVTWHHNGKEMQQKVPKGIILQNQTLVLQRISRDAAGLYTCAARNTEGDGESQPVDLKVKYKPYCRRHSKTIYGTALHEPASVTCEVEASPGPVTFRWTFNNTSEHLPIPASAVTSQGQTSVASYAPKSHLDYGTLLCWAFNSIGEQSTPCAFAIIPAGPPDSPRNCSIANQTTDTIEVECVAGFDGGLPQAFYMEVYDSTTGTLHRNISSKDPLFLLTALRPGLAWLMVTYAANAKGRSDVFKLETFTLKVAEKRTGPPALLEFTPFLGIVLGVVLVIFLVVIVIIVVFKFRNVQPSRRQEGGGAGGVVVAGGGVVAGAGGGGAGGADDYKGDLLESKPLRSREGGSSGGEVEDNDPDLIPHNKAELMQSYPHYEAIERGGPSQQQQQQQQQPLPQFPATFDPVPAIRQSPLQRNPIGPGGDVNYVERPLTASSPPCGGGGMSGYMGTTATDAHNLYDHRRSLSINPPAPAPDDPSTAPMSMYATLGYQRGSIGGGSAMGTTGGLSVPHHSSNPNLYSMWDYRRGVTSTTLNPSLYATLPNRRDNHSTFASSMSVSNMSNNNGSPPGFRDFRRSIVTPLIRRPNESVV